MYNTKQEIKLKIYYYSFSLFLLVPTTGYSASHAPEAGPTEQKKNTTVTPVKPGEGHSPKPSIGKSSLGAIPEDAEYDFKGEKGHIPDIPEESEEEEADQE